MRAGDAGHRQRRAASGIAVELGQHHAGEIHALVEGLGGFHGVLTDHRIDDEQDLVGLHGITNVARLLHQGLIDAQTAGGVDDHHVVQLLLGEFDAVARHLHRVAGGQARGGDRVAAIGLHTLLGGVDGDSGAFSHHLQLGDGVRTLQIGGHQQRGVAGVLEPVAQFAGKRGLARALQAGEHDDRRRVLGEIQRAVHPLPQHVGELLIDDLHDLLGGIQRFGNLGAERALADPAGEGPHHVKRHVGVKQCAANLADGAVDIRL